ARDGRGRGRRGGRAASGGTAAGPPAAPPRGGGGGGGGGHARRLVQAHPLPNPPPQAGEGAHRVSGQEACRVRGTVGELLRNRCYSDHSLRTKRPCRPCSRFTKMCWRTAPRSRCRRPRA